MTKLGEGWRKIEFPEIQELFDKAWQHHQSSKMQYSLSKLTKDKKERGDEFTIDVERLHKLKQEKLSRNKQGLSPSMTNYNRSTQRGINSDLK